jgi:hypothetical protein
LQEYGQLKGAIFIQQQSLVEYVWLNARLHTSLNTPGCVCCGALASSVIETRFKNKMKGEI